MELIRINAERFYKQVVLNETQYKIDFIMRHPCRSELFVDGSSQIKLEFRRSDVFSF